MTEGISHTQGPGIATAKPPSGHGTPAVPWGYALAKPGSASAAKWLTVILLAVIATCLLIEVGLSSSTARGQLTGQGRAPAAFAVAGKVTPETYGLYLVDLERGTICIYQYLPANRRLRLMAARTTVFDRQLEDFNNEKPTPREVKRIVEQQKPLSSTPPSK